MRDYLAPGTFSFNSYHAHGCIGSARDEHRVMNFGTCYDAHVYAYNATDKMIYDHEHGNTDCTDKSTVANKWEVGKCNDDPAYPTSIKYELESSFINQFII